MTLKVNTSRPAAALVNVLAESSKRGGPSLPSSVEIASLRIGDSIEVVVATDEHSRRVVSKGERAWARVTGPMNHDNLLTAVLLAPVGTYPAEQPIVVEPVHIARIVRRRVLP